MRRLFLLTLSLGLALLMMLPDALLALWLKVIVDGAIDGDRSRVVTAGVGLAISVAATWYLSVLSQRVQRRFARLEGQDPAGFGDLACVLRARPRRGGVDLLLLDLDLEGERALRERSSALSPPAAPTLEELFVDLTREAAEEVAP